MEKNRNEQDLKIIEKAKFYFTNELKAHVLIIPKGKFRNGMFASELMEDQYYWFLESDSSMPIRLFLREIYDIEDYQEVDDEKNTK